MREPAEHRLALPGAPVDLDVESGRQHTAEIALDPPARDVREGVGRVAQAPHVVEVEPRRREQVGTVVILELEHAPDEREAVCMDAGRGEPHDEVALDDRRGVDQAVTLDDPDTGRSEVELVGPVHVRQLGRLAADERDARHTADFRSALDELGDLVEIDARGGDVVEDEERVRAGGDHVVDAVGGHVGAARSQRAARPGDDRLGPDRVHRRRKQPPLVERKHARKGAEARSAGRLDGCAQPLDDRVGGGEGHPRGGVCLLLGGHASSVVDRSARTGR
jgi:hypothetical protein